MAKRRFWQRGDAAPEAEVVSNATEYYAAIPAEAWTESAVEPERPSTPVVSFGDLPQASMIQAPYVESWDDGEKFFGGFGTTQLLTLDYWALRARSAQLFEVNHYARGIIRTLTTNLVNTGLH